MQLLVTGGAGFIGANFVHSAVGEHAVTVLDALTYAASRASLAPVQDDIRLIEGDVTDIANNRAYPNPPRQNEFFTLWQKTAK